MMDLNKIPSPCYVLEEDRLRRNLSLIKDVKERAGIDIILALKAFAQWKAFPIIGEYIPHATASSIHEARLVYEELGNRAHTYSPAYTDADFSTFLLYSSHLTFNSLGQYAHFKDRVTGHPVSCGLRINPECPVVLNDLYNPCMPGSRLGITAHQLGHLLPEGIEGLHFHVLCESTSYDLARVLETVEERFGHLFGQIKWINMGGGHLMTHADYNVAHLISLLQGFKQRHPHLHVILEPGSAFVWQTGFLLTTVVDVVENQGIQTAVIDASFTCHMPDCLEMPYKPTVRHATNPVEGKPTYRLGGSSCLSGDFMGNWSFDQPLRIGDRIVFEDMIHYTVVKTNMFNGIAHPSVVLWSSGGEVVPYRTYGYEDYKSRMC